MTLRGPAPLQDVVLRGPVPPELSDSARTETSDIQVTRHKQSDVSITHVII